MTSKQRAYLKGLAMTMDPILQLGKGGLTPENTAAVDEALAARELIKISVLQNCLEDPRQMAEVLAERTRSQIVQVIGKKIVLYREGKNEKKKIEGTRNSSWVLMDYGDMIVHVFDEENRLFYDLERIWRDGKVLDVNEFLEK